MVLLESEKVTLAVQNSYAEIKGFTINFSNKNRYPNFYKKGKIATWVIPEGWRVENLEDKQYKDHKTFHNFLEAISYAEELYEKEEKNKLNSGYFKYKAVCIGGPLEGKIVSSPTKTLVLSETDSDIIIETAASKTPTFELFYSKFTYNYNRAYLYTAISDEDLHIWLPDNMTRSEVNSELFRYYQTNRLN